MRVVRIRCCPERKHNYKKSVDAFSKDSSEFGTAFLQRPFATEQDGYGYFIPWRTKLLLRFKAGRTESLSRDYKYYLSHYFHGIVL